MMAVARTLLRLGVTDRELFLFDTFSGMTEPTVEDQDSPYDGYSLKWMWRRRRRDNGMNWSAVPAERVRAAMATTGYPVGRVHLVEGPVEDTLPEEAPGDLALLRLDTDWYGSTRHEIEQLWPRLTEGGVLLLDDYGHYQGARRAIDEYFDRNGERPLLHRIDYTGRVGIKHGHRGTRVDVVPE